MSEEAKSADEVTVHGQTLRGRVVRLGPKGIGINTIYGEGRLSIPYEDIETVVSRDKYLIFYGDGQVVRGRLLGIQNGDLLVGPDRSSAQRVPVKDIQIGMSAEDYDTSLLTRLRTRFRHWRGSFDVGYKYETGAVDKNKLELGLNLNRRKSPTRFVFEIAQAFEVQQARDSPDVTTKDEFVIFVQAEYDVRSQFFLFVRPAYEFDKPRNIEDRWYPAAGVGYRFVENQMTQSLLQVPVGVGHVDEDFGGIGTNSYASWYIGLEGRYDFGNGIILGGKLLYMPGIENPGEDSLLRAELDFTVPIFDPVALKLQITDANDNNPTPEVGDNKFTTALVLSLVF
jgi:hypothetical protein